ncbi:hypothetical protein L6452_09354 [Arctium lappa]|uniref:Uncharacterized protein n=1 Tax=Arctium lappa TaxID=4217 RepID=A0ACB9DK42_ARCLA|nr:hypothetical protein L6452_09354 [Arctium lappa]
MHGRVLYTWRSQIGFGSLNFGRHAFGRVMNSVVDRVVVRMVAETYRGSAIAEAFPHVPSRICRVVFASLISADYVGYLLQELSVITEQTQSNH